jgi:hypothetical protein
MGSQGDTTLENSVIRGSRNVDVRLNKNDGTHTVNNVIIGFNEEDNLFITGGVGMIIGGGLAHITLTDVSVLNTVLEGIKINNIETRESLTFNGVTSCGGTNRTSGDDIAIEGLGDDFVVEDGTPFIYGGCNDFSGQDECNLLQAERTSTCSSCPIPSI